MGATLSELRSRVQTRAEHARNASFVDQLVNEASQEVAAKFDWPWLIERDAPITDGEELTANTTYAFPTTANLGDAAGSIILAVKVNGHELEEVSALDDQFSRDLRHRTWALGGDGGETDVTTDGRAVFTIRPAINAGETVTVSWRRLENVLTDDADTTICPADFAYGPVVSLAVSKAYLAHPDESNAHVFYQREYERQLATHMVQRRRSRGPIVPRTRVGHTLLGH